MAIVEVKASRNYDIVIEAGLLDRAGELMSARFKPCRVAILTDDTVDALYGARAEKAIADAGFTVSKFAFPHGEGSKNLNTLSDMLEFMAENGLTRSDMVAALGGGVTGDMAGLAASMYARGIRFVQIPTTLLAAVDSSVGGKTAVNLRAGKNLAGAFYQPSLVICDTEILHNLPQELLSDGAAEIIKYGILADEKLFDTLRAGGLCEHMEEIVAECVTIKRDVVAEDEFDTGRRQLLNLGHTLGHSVEQRSHYSMTHGHGVAIGMTLIARAAYKLGYLKEDMIPALNEALEKNGLPTVCPYPAEDLLGAAMLDKKRKGGKITLVVPEKIGSCALIDVPAADLEKWIHLGVEA